MEKTHKLYTFTMYGWGLLASSVLVCLTFVLQTYRLTALEEEYIFLFDSSYIFRLLGQAGGAAQLAASFLTQFFLYEWAGPLITGVLYIVSTVALCNLAVKRRSAVFTAALACLPALCLFLCLENSAYEYQGTVAVVMNVLAMPWIFGLINRIGGKWATIVIWISTTLMVWLTGFAAVILVAGYIVYWLQFKRPAIWQVASALAVILVFFGVCYLFCLCAGYKTEVFSPAMYYDMGSTYFMSIYAMVAVIVFLGVTRFARRSDKPITWRGQLTCLAVIIVEFAAMLNLYNKIHSDSNYANHQQRYYARNERWDDIIGMQYDGSPTPYTSYIFLALAEKGKLIDAIDGYKPFISYLFENKPKVKKRDQQVYSDIYYACHYMAAARHSAFDTNIVTPGEFNPYETQKLAVINIAYGDYEVAEKMLAKLEKTLFYKEWAMSMRKYLHNDALVEADSKLGAMRKVISSDNFYLSPKGMMRDLKYVTVANPDLTPTKEFYKAFLKLTNQTDDALPL